ncbi:MAG: thioredoxin-like domain-containing protein [Planctomycetota bacterium]
MPRTPAPFTSALVALALALGVARPASAQSAPPSAPSSPDVRPINPTGGWINTDGPLTLEGDLKGHVVLLDFWTYCCINCIHVIPMLERLEEKYADEPFVVIGVHSAKFEAEGDIENIRQAVERYGRRHPIAVDTDFEVWRRFGARAWPTLVLIGPDGVPVGQVSGEGNEEILDNAIAELLREGRVAGTLAPPQRRFQLPEAEAPELDRLRFPGKVTYLAPGDDRDAMLYIADSSHERFILTTLPDAEGNARVLRTFGDGVRGRRDGGDTAGPAPARFNDPQGSVLDPSTGTLYVADTANHLIRAVDLSTGAVTTIAGTGERGYDRSGGQRGIAQPIASPWALEIDPDRQILYIAMAGTHQIWSMDLRSRVVANLAGSGAENIYDDTFEDSAFAQPSGLQLSPDRRTLYAMDTEGSAVRALDLDTRTVRTLVGRAVANPFTDSSLFDFGNQDGATGIGRLQHAVGIAAWPPNAPERLLLADTYNNALRWLDPQTGELTTPVYSAGLELDEPKGLVALPATDTAPARIVIADTNAHRLLLLDPDTGDATELEIEGLD